MAPKKNWHTYEDEALCRAFVQHSDDPIHGINKKEKLLWDGIIGSMYETIASQGIQAEHRSKEAIMCRWKKVIFKECNKWYSALTEAQRAYASGTNLQDEQGMAHAIYKNQHGSTFTLHHCWAILQHRITYTNLSNTAPTQTQTSTDRFQTQSSHFSSQQMESPPPGYTPHFNFTPDEAQFDTPSSLGTPSEENTSGRPMGTKKAKKGKAKASANSASLESYSQSIRETNEVNRMLEEGRVRRHAELMAMKEEENDLKILTMDTSTFTPDTKALFKLKRKQIQQKQLAKNLFGGGSSNPGNNPFDYYPNA